MRTSNAVSRHKRKRKIMKAARGFRGSRRKLLRVAKDGVMRASAYAYVGRKQKKRDYRALWIVRINAAVRQHGMTYSQFIGRLGKSDIDLDRKALADLAVNDPAAFTKIVEAVGQA